jgi:hypothetical protein
VINTRLATAQVAQLLSCGSCTWQADFRMGALLVMADTSLFVFVAFASRACWSQCPPRCGCNKYSATGTRTRVARVRAEYPNQLDYSGSCSMHCPQAWPWPPPPVARRASTAGVLRRTRAQYWGRSRAPSQWPPRTPGARVSMVTVWVAGRLAGRLAGAGPRQRRAP